MLNKLEGNEVVQVKLIRSRYGQWGGDPTAQGRQRRLSKSQTNGWPWRKCCSGYSRWTLGSRSSEHHRTERGRRTRRRRSVLLARTKEKKPEKSPHHLIPAMLEFGWSPYLPNTLHGQSLSVKFMVVFHLENCKFSLTSLPAAVFKSFQTILPLAAWNMFSKCYPDYVY